MIAYQDSTKQVFKMSVPIFVELLLQLLVGNVDQFMVSHYSQNSVAAIGNANQVMNIVIIVLNVMSVATTILLSQYSSTETALCAYNAGMGRVGEWLSDSAYSSDGVTLHTIPFPETENYVSAVMENYSVYHKLYQFQLNGGVMHVEKK